MCDFGIKYYYKIGFDSEMRLKESSKKEILRMKKALELERDKSDEVSKELSERVCRFDDEFRKQYDVEKREHLRIIEIIKREYERKLKYIQFIL